jgi:hypothetical protein
MKDINKIAEYNKIKKQIRDNTYENKDKFKNFCKNVLYMIIRGSLLYFAFLHNSKYQSNIQNLYIIYIIMAILSGILLNFSSICVCINNIDMKISVLKSKQIKNSFFNFIGYVLFASEITVLAWNGWYFSCFVIIYLLLSILFLKVILKNKYKELMDED